MGTIYVGTYDLMFLFEDFIRTFFCDFISSCFPVYVLGILFHLKNYSIDDSTWPRIPHCIMRVPGVDTYQSGQINVPEFHAFLLDSLPAVEHIANVVQVNNRELYYSVVYRVVCMCTPRCRRENASCVQRRIREDWGWCQLCVKFRSIFVSITEASFNVSYHVGATGLIFDSWYNRDNNGYNHCITMYKVWLPCRIRPIRSSQYRSVRTCVLSGNFKI